MVTVRLNGITTMKQKNLNRKKGDNKMTLYELLTSFDEIKKFDLTKKLKIFVLSSKSLNLLNAEVMEYFLGDVPLYLLCKEVSRVYHDENAILIFK